MEKIAVLLTVFNRKDTTLRCLHQLYAQTSIEGIKLDVFLTNDGCTDGTPETVREQYPQVNVIDAHGDLFWNRGMYTAWEEAAKNDYDFYLWLNDDTFTYPYMLKELLSTSKEQNDRAIIVGATETSGKSKPSYGGRDKDGHIPMPNGKPTEVYCFNGNIVLVPKSVYKRLGKLDFYYTHSKGDIDYGIRATKAGIKIFQVGLFLGICDLHPNIDKWCDPKIPLKERWRLMMRPNGMPPQETFHLEKQTNVLMASLHFMTVIIRCLFPSLWLRNKKVSGFHK